MDDLGGLSIIRGYGIYFHGYTDKPLYMIFLSFFHLIAGNNYSLLTWIQILVLGFIPVVLYLLGKKFHGQGFGLFLALITILRQRNAIVLSYKIASVNPKLLITEVMTLLGIVLLAYVVFLWLRTQKLWLAALSGGIHRSRFVNPDESFFLVPGDCLFGFGCFLETSKIEMEAPSTLYPGFFDRGDTLVHYRGKPEWRAMGFSESHRCDQQSLWKRYSAQRKSDKPASLTRNTNYQSDGIRALNATTYFVTEFQLNNPPHLYPYNPLQFQTCNRSALSRK